MSDIKKQPSADEQMIRLLESGYGMHVHMSGPHLSVTFMKGMGGHQFKGEGATLDAAIRNAIVSMYADAQAVLEATS